MNGNIAMVRLMARRLSRPSEATALLTAMPAGQSPRWLLPAGRPSLGLLPAGLDGNKRAFRC